MKKAPSLMECLAALPDHRSPQGKRHPLPALVALTVVAMLSDQHHVSAIAGFGRGHGRAFARLLGFTHHKMPCTATLCGFYQKLDLDALAAAITTWLQPMLSPQRRRSLSLDGKTLRGTRTDALGAMHLLTALAHEAGIVLAQEEVDHKTNEHKTALQLINILPMDRAIVMGDAAFCQRDLSKCILEKQGDYLWPVKENQPELRAAIARLFDHPFSPSALLHAA